MHTRHTLPCRPLQPYLILVELDGFGLGRDFGGLLLLLVVELLAGRLGALRRRAQVGEHRGGPGREYRRPGHTRSWQTDRVRGYTLRLTTFVNCT